VCVCVFIRVCIYMYIFLIIRKIISVGAYCIII
jgi:hypothetical protein